MVCCGFCSPSVAMASMPLSPLLLLLLLLRPVLSDAHFATATGDDGTHALGLEIPGLRPWTSCMLGHRFCKYSRWLMKQKHALFFRRYADLARLEMENGNFSNATRIWSDTQEAVMKITDDVDFYNLLKHHSNPYASSANVSGPARLAARHFSVTETSDLAQLMNGPIRQKLGIIPNNISWSQFSELVFDALSGDFMKDNIQQVDELLAAGVNITIYSGQKFGF